MCLFQCREQPQREPCCQSWGQPCIQPSTLGLLSPPLHPGCCSRRRTEPPALHLSTASSCPRKYPFFYHTACSIREAEAQEQVEEALQHDVATKVGRSLSNQRLVQLEPRLGEKATVLSAEVFSRGRYKAV